MAWSTKFNLNHYRPKQWCTARKKQQKKKTLLKQWQDISHKGTCSWHGCSIGIIIYFYVCCRRLAHAAGGELAA
jgi:transcription initiation factor TFIID subunit TAF12